MKKLLIGFLLTACTLQAADLKEGWISLFDGKTLDGWRANENPSSFRVEEGMIVVNGPRAHLFYVGPVQNHKFKNFEFQAEVMTQPESNSGVYLHTEFQESGWPGKGYEIQVNNTHRDPKKTAGLYGIEDNLQAPAKDGEWFTLHILVQGKRIVTKVDGKTIVDFTEEPNPQRSGMFAGRLLGSGTFALQGHDPVSKVCFKNIQVKPLP